MFKCTNQQLNKAQKSFKVFTVGFARYWLAVSVIWPLGGMELPVVAQSLPNPILPREPQPPNPNLPVPQPAPLVPAEPILPPSLPIPESQQTITVEKFDFEGNTAFSDTQLAAVTRRFIGKPITFTELLEVETAITQKYVEAGYINSGAVIPANQTFAKDRAIVKVQIIEGTVAQIQVNGTRRLNPGYVRSRLAIASGPPLNRDRLLEALQLLQLDPLIQSISAELRPGLRPELSQLQVRVREADTVNVEVFIDNERSPSVGSFRRGIRLNQANLLGLGDGIEVAYSNSDGSHDYDISYTVPINPRNGTITISGSYTDTRVVEPPFDRIDIEGKSFGIDLTFRQPLILRPTREFGLGVSASYQNSQTFVLEREFPLALGADERGRTIVSALRLFQDFVHRSPKEVFAVRSQFSFGLDVFDATSNETGPDSQFFSWRGQGQYVRLLAPETLLIFRTDLQFSPNPLVSLEQFGLGGARSVRGYRQDSLLTDNGVFVSAEARIPILRVPQLRGILQVTPFVDFGVGWFNENQIPLDKNTLAGAGIGLLWQMGDNLSARIDYAIPLIDVNANDRTLQEQGVYFSVRYSPF